MILYFYLQTNIHIFALGFEIHTLISEFFYFSINLSGGGEPHNVIEDGHRESTASLANRSGIMADNKKHEKTALGIAYAAVVELGYTHSQLVNLNEGVNFHTLRNIRDEKKVKKVTERFYLKLFFDLINKEYNRRITSGANGAVSLLVVMKNILEAELK